MLTAKNPIKSKTSPVFPCFAVKKGNFILCVPLFSLRVSAPPREPLLRLPIRVSSVADFPFFHGFSVLCDLCVPLRPNRFSPPREGPHLFILHKCGDGL